MKTALIGYTGFVGSNIYAQQTFTDLYNSKNIHSIRGKEYDLVVNAGVTGTKWIANARPQEDIARINDLATHLRKVKTRQIIHISTFDVYPDTLHVDEHSPIDPKENFAYGSNRYVIEEFIKSTFPVHTIIRLPGLYGLHLKKNFIYDFIHRRKLYLTDSRNIVQMYNLGHIWSDISIAIQKELALVNFAVEPVPLKEIVKKIFHVDFENVTQQKPTHYDVRTIHGKEYGCASHYLYSKEQVISELNDFVRSSIASGFF